MSKWKVWFKRELIEEVDSEINRSIQVVKVMSQPRLMIGGMIQSGGMVRQIWEKAVGKLAKEDKEIRRALILGLGGGDCARVINKYYPKAEIIGVEIDKQVVKMTKKHFRLEEIKNLRVVLADGIDEVKKLVKEKQKFDLVIIDVFVGSQMPEGFKSKRFLEQVKRLLSPRGMTVINHLFFGKFKSPAEELVKTIEKVFKEIKLQRTASNLIIFAS